MIQNLPLANVRSGARLGLDLCDAKGNRLLARGSVLSDAHLAMCHKRGIAMLPVVVDVVLSPEEYTRRENEITMALDHQFRHVSTDPLMSGLRGVLRDYRVEKLQ